jgi:heptosyltransferase-1
MTYSNILLIKMSSLGDVIHTLPFIAVLRRRFPQAKITWLVHPQFAAFLPDPPLVDQVLYFDKVKFNHMGWGEKLRYFQEMRTKLRAQHFDLVIDLQGLFKSAVLACLTGCPERIGYCEMREGSGLVSKAITGPHAKDHVIERYLDVARYLGCTVNSIDFPMPDLSAEWEQVRTKLTASGLNLQAAKVGKTAGAEPQVTAAKNAAVPAENYVVMVPGARWETKVYPAAQFAKLAQLILAEGTPVVLAGSKDDAAFGREIVTLTPGVTNLIGRTSLRELGALIQHCRFYFSADTGPLFIATAFKKPLAAVYGPTRPERTGPYGFDGARVLVAPVPCAGCLQKQCDHWDCMASVAPEQLFAVYQDKTGGAGHGTES